MSPHTKRRSIKQELLGLAVLLVVAGTAPVTFPVGAELIETEVAPYVVGLMTGGRA